MDFLKKDYEFFLVCAESKTMVQAAEKLEIQQAGLSKVILKLEDRLGEKLFYRKTQGIELTEYGRHLQSALAQARSQWQRIYQEEFEGETGPSGIFKIGCHPSVGADILHRFLPALIEKYPNLIPMVEFHTSLDTSRLVAQLKLDLGLVVSAVKNPDLVLKPLTQEFVALWAKSTNATEVIYYNPEMYLGPKLIKKFKNHRMIEVPDYEVIAQLVANTNALGIIPSTVAERAGLKQQGEKILTVQRHLIWHKDKFRSAKKAELVRTISDLLKPEKL